MRDQFAEALEASTSVSRGWLAFASASSRTMGPTNNKAPAFLRGAIL
jgi:hypothetical protein